MLPKQEFDQIVANTERVKRWVIVLFLGAIVLVSGTAFAATYGLEDQQGNKVVLHDEDCPVPFLKGWKRADFRYLDGGSRAGGKGTSNFVVFPGNESILKILGRE